MNVSNLKSDLWKRLSAIVLSKGRRMKPRLEEKLLLSFKEYSIILPRIVHHKVIFVGPRTIAFNPAFGSFTLLELVSH
jgi:hypothetical protein